MDSRDTLGRSFWSERTYKNSLRAVLQITKSKFRCFPVEFWFHGLKVNPESCAIHVVGDPTSPSFSPARLEYELHCIFIGCRLKRINSDYRAARPLRASARLARTAGKAAMVVFAPAQPGGTHEHYSSFCGSKPIQESFRVGCLIAGSDGRCRQDANGKAAPGTPTRTRRCGASGRLPPRRSGFGLGRAGTDRRAKNVPVASHASDLSHALRRIRAYGCAKEGSESRSRGAEGYACRDRSWRAEFRLRYGRRRGSRHCRNGRPDGNSDVRAQLFRRGH